VALVVSAVVFGRRPRSTGRKSGAPGDQRKRLVDKREALFGELVALERASRAAGTPAPVDQRRQLVARLEQVYQDLASLEKDEPRAA
jgi:hypothetical protein